jgi:hypothetical protein
VLSPGLLVVHDTSRGGEDDLAEGTGGEEQVDPVLNGVNGDVEAGRDDARLVETAVELDDDLAASVVVDDLELADVACAERTERGSRVMCMGKVYCSSVVREMVKGGEKEGRTCQREFCTSHKFSTSPRLRVSNVILERPLQNTAVLQQSKPTPNRRRACPPPISPSSHQP